MPEENFEQQVRRRAEEFGVEPKPGVWLNVKAAIAPQERQRRVLLWWWLLPLCVAGIVAALYVNHKGAQPERGNVLSAEDGKRGWNHSQPDTIVVEMKNEAGSAVVINRRKENFPGATTGDKRINMQPTHLMGGSDGVEKTFTGEPYNGDIKDDKKIEQAMELEREKKSIQENNGQIITNENRQVQTDTLSFAYTDSMYTSNKLPLAKEFVSAPGKKDSLPSGIASAATEKDKKKKTRNSWQMGVMAELGVASWGKDLLVNEVKSNSLTQFDKANSATSLDSLVANTSQSWQTKNGLNIAAGLAVRKELQNRFYISGQLAYRYQQFIVYNIRHSVRPGPLSSSTAYLIGKDAYHNHFLNASVGAGRYVFTNKRNALAAEVELDNTLLLAMKHGKNQSSAFSNGSLTTGNFYRWQPHVSLSLPFDWRSDNKVKLVLAPFARIGLHTFQKDGNGLGNNRLISAGLQATYFFK